MKHLFLALLCFGFVLTSCTEETIIVEEVDPIIGSTFEVTVNFVSDDGFFANDIIGDEPNEIPDDIIITDGEVPLVFLFDSGTNTFEPIPVTFFPEDDLFAEYRFNFSLAQDGGIFDIELILESNDFDALGPVFTNNQIFRIVILPSIFVEANPNISFEELQSELNF